LAVLIAYLLSCYVCMDYIGSRWGKVEAVLWILKYLLRVRIRILELRIWIQEANKLRIRPDPT
jgi:hypothetical protein